MNEYIEQLIEQLEYAKIQFNDAHIEGTLKTDTENLSDLLDGTIDELSAILADYETGE